MSNRTNKQINEHKQGIQNPGKRKEEVKSTIDGDLVVVIDPDQVVEGQVTGQRGRFAADTFLQTSIAAECPHLRRMACKRECGEVRVRELRTMEKQWAQREKDWLEKETMKAG